MTELHQVTNEIKDAESYEIHIAAHSFLLASFYRLRSKYSIFGSLFFLVYAFALLR